MNVMYASPGKVHIICLLIFFSVLSASAQPGDSWVSIKASVEKKMILIGEQVNLHIVVSSPNPQLLSLPQIDTIPHFEILFKSDPERAGNSIRQTYRLTSFDSGHWVLPAFTVAGRHSSDTIHMDVVFSDFDPNQDYHDIKDIVGVNLPGMADWIWWIIIGAAVFLLLIIWLIFKRRKPVKKDAPAVDAYEEAMQRLNELKGLKLPDRQLFSEIVDVFRLYVFRKKGILSLQKTTDDLVLQLKDTGIQSDNFSQLTQALRLADFVKFAKYQSTEEDRRSTLNIIGRSIDEMEKLDSSP